MNQKKTIWSDVIVLFGLSLCVVVLLWPVFFQQKILLPLDMLFQVEPWANELPNMIPDSYHNPEPTDAIWQFYPMSSYISHAHRSGGLLWDPYVLGGMPALARGELFSNPIFLALSRFLSAGKALSWMAVIHLLIGLYSMYGFMRESGNGILGAAVGSLAFGLNSYLIGWLVFPNVVGSLVWVPLIFWGYERSVRRGWGWIVMGGLAFGLQVLAGSILWPGYTAISLALYALGRSLFIVIGAKQWKEGLWTFVKAGLLLAIGLLITAPQVLLTSELYLLTDRTAALGASSGLDGLLHLLRLFDPTLLGSPISEMGYQGTFNYTETTLYIGVPALLLTIVGIFENRRGFVLWIFGICAFSLLAVYNVPAIRQLVAIIYPFFLDTFPGRIFGMVAFFLAAVAGYHADWMLNSASLRSIRRGVWMTTGLTCFFLTLYLVVSTNIASYTPTQWILGQFGLQIDKVNSSSLLITTIWCAICAALLWLWGQRKIGPIVFAGLIVMVAAADLLLVNQDYHRAFDEAMLYPTTESTRVLQTTVEDEPSPVRILPVNSGIILPGMSPQVYRLPTASGYTSWVLSRYARYADLTGFRGKASINHVYFFGCCDRLLDALGIRYVYAAPNDFPAGASDRISLTDVLPSAAVETTFDSGVKISEWQVDRVTRPILSAHAPSRIAYPLYLKDSATLHTAISINSDIQTRNSDGVEFEVWAQRDDSADRELLFSAYLNPPENNLVNNSMSVEIDLSPYSGVPIVLTLETNPGPNQDNNLDWSGWVEPTIVLASGPPLELIYDGPNRIYRNKNALPKAWMVGNVQQVEPGDLEAVTRLLADPFFRPEQSAMVESVLATSDIPHNQTAPINASINFINYEAESVDMTVNTAEPGLLILSDTMYPGWKAYIDGVEKPVYYTNLIMRGVYLTAGEHQVQFRFEPKLLMVGRAISTITMALIGFAFAYFFARRRKMQA